MESSTSDNQEEFVPTTLPSVEREVTSEEAIKLRLIPQGAGSKLDSDTIRGQVPTNDIFNKVSGDVLGRLLGMLYGS